MIQKSRLLVLVVLLFCGLQVASPFLNSEANNSLPLSAIGDDYLMWNHWNGNPDDGWGQTTVLDSLSYWHCSGARLLFTFSDCPGAGVSGEGAASTLVYSKLDSVLGYLNSVGVKAILCDWASTEGGWYGSLAWNNDWVALATHFAGDTRIKAFELTSEPTTKMFSSSGYTGGITNLHSFDVAMSDLIARVRSVDPSRTIMYPIVANFLFEPNATNFNSWFRDLDGVGVTSKGNILFDIVHPYYFQDCPRMDSYGNPVDCCDAIWNQICLPQINHFGVSNCWCGETFCWPRGTNVSNGGGGWNGELNINYNDQQTFERRMINYFVSAGLGFQMQQFITSSDKSAQVDALANSEYNNLIKSESAIEATHSTYQPTPLNLLTTSTWIILAILPITLLYVILKKIQKKGH